MTEYEYDQKQLYVVQIKPPDEEAVWRMTVYLRTFLKFVCFVRTFAQYISQTAAVKRSAATN